jgi:hypothetical protein
VSKPRIKIYGERNTGTRYLSRLVDLNLDVVQLRGSVPRGVTGLQRVLPGKEGIRDLYFALTYGQNLGWKHAVVEPAAVIRRYQIAANHLSFVTITKNPYSWLLSLHERPYHQYYARAKPAFENFVAAPWKTVGRENAPKALSSPVELWNLKNASYRQLGDAFPALNIRYEDLVEDPAHILALMSQAFSCSWKADQFRNYDPSTKEPGKDSAFYRDYYRNERWKDGLSPAAIARINERLDVDLVDHFGYEWLVPESPAHLRPSPLPGRPTTLTA